MYSAVPDGHIEILDMIAEGDRIAMFQEVTGTVTRELFGLKSKGKPVDRVFASIHEFKDGKIISAATRDVIDNLSFYQKLGALPRTEEIRKLTATL